MRDTSVTLLEHVGLRCPQHPGGGEGEPGAGWIQLWREVQAEDRPCAMLERLTDPGPRVTEGILVAYKWEN